MHDSDRQSTDDRSDANVASSFPVNSEICPEQDDTSVADKAPVVLDEHAAVAELMTVTANRRVWEAAQRRRRRQRRISIALFVLTFLSTTLVGADYWPLDILPGFFNDQTRIDILDHLNRIWPPSEGVASLSDRFLQSVLMGCTYSIPLMLILFCHEMGHYIQAVRYKVPASLPYFIPLPLPPLGTMGAVILQGRGVADRKQMFDIAVTGPLAGLVVTLPILIYGIVTSGYVPTSPQHGFEFGQPLMVRWLIEMIHGPAMPGMMFEWNGYATAGWVGIFVTAMNMLPIGQLDGGHILYTLIGRRAHWVAWGLILSAVAIMIQTQMFSYVLLLILLMLTGPRHPPTADDSMALGVRRHLLGWCTLAFLLVGFTMQPIVIPDRRGNEAPPNVLEAVPLNAVPFDDV